MRKHSPQRTLLALAASLLLAACATQHVAGPATQPLDAAALGSSIQPQAVSSNWWRKVPDTTLQQLIDKALAGNPGLAQADARLRSARASSEQVASSDGLHINGSADFTRERISNYANLPSFMTGVWTNLTTVGVDLSYRFDFWGKTRAQLAASRGQAHAATLEADDARHWLAWTVSSQYLEWRSAQESRQLLQDDLQLARQQLAQAQQKLNSGLSAADELAQYRAQLAEAEERLQRSSMREAQASHALAALTAQPQSAIDQLPPARLPDWNIDLPQLSTGQLGLRADILAARERVEASAENVKAAKADFYPDVHIDALGAFSSNELSTLFNYGARYIHLAPAITLPIFSNGALDARLDARTAEYDYAVASYNQTLLAAIRDTADRSSSLQVLQQAEKAAAANLQARSDAARSVQGRVKAGLAAPSLGLAEQRRLLQARSATLDTHTQRLQAQAALLRALGSLPADKE
ncbi:efflux transporter outer membrane subunit [Vogesella sp. LIG4]|uniref:efflux transporter outer membrane subunit n=1 Tax=Vogesella sp. LIG4 TaxID=1192162 RepID=UPI00081FA4E0|nr:efflux transporter outer membrane subunit [Vogesella sp. LIG4]SCK20079.1 efflux transporter, outer membrane factor (OMF) lipoprotein, NodT family [Vogesella sp. LIG4]